MSNTDRFIEKLARRVSDLELKVDRINKKCSAVTKRCSDIYHNQKHYLRYRADKVGKRQAALLDAARRMAKKLEAIPRMNIKMTGKKTKGAVRTLLLVTPNHAKKLRALAEMDLRPLLNSRFNKGRKRRTLGSGKKSPYRVTE